MKKGLKKLQKRLAMNKRMLTMKKGLKKLQKRLAMNKRMLTMKKGLKKLQKRLAVNKRMLTMKKGLKKVQKHTLSKTMEKLYLKDPLRVMIKTREKLPLRMQIMRNKLQRKNHLVIQMAILTKMFLMGILTNILLTKTKRIPQNMILMKK